MLRRRALVFALAAGSLFPLRMVMSECDAAPVPPMPKADDSVSASASRLLAHRKIQKELKLSAEQRLAILDGIADLDDEHQKKVEELVRMPNFDNAAFDKLAAERQKQGDKLLTGLAAKSLTAAQRARLQQLDYRLRGPTAFTDPRVEKKLVLTDAQKKLAKETAERMSAELNRYLDGNGDDTPDRRKAELFDFRKARTKDMLGALTADQKTAWELMLGVAPTGFEVDELWLKVEEELDALATNGG